MLIQQGEGNKAGCAAGQSGVEGFARFGGAYENIARTCYAFRDAAPGAVVRQIASARVVREVYMGTKIETVREASPQQSETELSGQLPVWSPLCLETEQQQQLTRLAEHLSQGHFRERSRGGQRRQDIEVHVKAAGDDFVRFQELSLTTWDRNSGTKFIVKFANSEGGMVIDSIMEKPRRMGADSREEIVIPRPPSVRDLPLVEETIWDACRCVGSGSGYLDHESSLFRAYSLFLPVPRMRAGE